MDKSNRHYKESYDVVVKFINVMKERGHTYDDVFDLINQVDTDSCSDCNLYCAVCSRIIQSNQAHLHQGVYIGDECCWDERLKITE